MATILAFVRSSSKNKKVFVRFRLRDGRNVQAFYVSNIQLDYELFDHKKEQIKTRCLIDETLRIKINKEIQNIKEIISNVYHNRSATDIFNSEYLTKKIEQIIDPNYCEEFTFDKICDLFIANKNICRERKNQYKITFNIVRRFFQYYNKIKTKDNIHLNNATTTVFNDFIMYAKFEGDYLKQYPFIRASEYMKQTPKNRSDNTISLIWSEIKAFMNWAITNNYYSNTAYKNVKIAPEVYGTPIYISVEERNLIYNYDYQDASIEISKDIFVFQCCVGCRVGDMMKLKKNSVINNIIEYIPSKTLKEKGSTVRVPLNKIAIEIVEKYKNCQGEALLPFIAYHYYNYNIKKIFKIVGIDRLVTVRDSNTGQEKKVSIADIASSHMARRTFVGNLYKQVKDPNLVGSMSGHSYGSTAFARYREIDDDIQKELVALIE